MSYHRPAIAYLELYVADDRSAVEYFTRGLFFDKLAVAHTVHSRSTLLRSHAAEVIVTTPTGPDGPVAAHLADHGDGVADVALYHDDLETLVDQARAAGLEVLAPVHSTSLAGPRIARIAGAGSVHHTLLSTTSHLLGRLPPGFAWESEQVTVPVPVASRSTSVRPQAIDHLTWHLPAESLENVTARYQEAFNLSSSPSERVTTGTATTHCKVLSAPGLVFVLTAPDSEQQSQPSDYVDDLLSARGPAGVQHVALRTNDLLTAVRLHVRGGVQFLPTPDAYYDQLPTSLTELPQLRGRLDELRNSGVLVDHNGSVGNLLYQIFTTSPHTSRSPDHGGTLFYELIQRDGGGDTEFGRRNIRALFQAREDVPPAAPPALPTDRD